MKKVIVSMLIILALASMGYADIETEPNNNKETADILSSGTQIQGQSMSIEDQDWFSIITTGADTININFKSNDGGGYVSVQDSEGNLLSNSLAYSEIIFDVGVSTRGVYYVVVKDRPTTISYTLTATAKNIAPGSGCTQEQLKIEYDNGYQAGIAECSNGLYTQSDVDEIIQAILTWGDTDGDGKIGLTEAIRALQITSGTLKDKE
ncbi:exported hypothetical protein [Candidatus Magnetomoraceae bacterium gMMP-15]